MPRNNQFSQAGRLSLSNSIVKQLVKQLVKQHRGKQFRLTCTLRRDV